MKNDQLFLQNLTDFRDLRSETRKQQDKNYMSKSSSGTSQNFSPQLQIQLHNNDRLLKNFKELRQQLKDSYRNCQSLKNNLVQRENELDAYKLSEKNHVASIYQLKHELEHYKNQNEDYKLRFEHLQELSQSSKKQKQELDYLKILSYELKSKLEKSESENKKIMEISICQKVELQQKIKRMQAKANSDLQYVQEMEIQSSKLRQKNIKLENELKKAEIRYDQELYNKKWLGGNFQKEHFQQQIEQLTKQNNQMLIKLKKQKDKRGNLEKKVLQLEEITGLWTVKAQTYQIQNKNYNKKFKKLEKKMAQTKQTADLQIQQTLNFQQKFLKSVSIAEELISRVKRDMYGEVVSLAKSCEFKLNKLKQQKQSKQSEARKSPSISKLRSKSRVNIKQTRETVSPLAQKLEKDYELKNQTLNSRTVNKIQNICRPLFQTEDFVKTYTEKQYDDQTSHSSGNKQNNYQPLTQVQNIQSKIRKQREEMEKRIRQKLLYRKIEAASGSPQKQKLREDYFRLIDR